MKDARSDIEDALLVMDAQDGNAAAMEKLVGRWQKRLWNHAYRLVGNADAAWDVTQQSWLGIIKCLNKLHDPESFKAWAYKITTNKSIDWARKNKTAERVDIEEYRRHQQKEVKNVGIEEFLQRLDEKGRTVLSLYYFEQLNVAEIGEVLKIPRGTVKSRLHSAKRKFREIWQKYSE